MSKMQDSIQNLLTTQETVKVYIPGKGYRLAKIEAISDDVVTIKPESGSKVIFHYTMFTVESS